MVHSDKEAYICKQLMPQWNICSEFFEQLDKIDEIRD